MILFFLIAQLNNNTFASSFSSEEDHDNLTGNGGISILIPADKNLTGSDRFLTSLLLLSPFVGIGYHLNIIENVFSPGIYADIHLNIIPALFLLAVFSQENDIKDTEDYEKWHIQDPFLIIQPGIRFYNQFRIDSFDIQPFIGLNIISGSIDTAILRIFGMLIAYKNAGLEYSYQQPFANHLNNDKDSAHRIAFLFHMR